MMDNTNSERYQRLISKQKSLYEKYDFETDVAEKIKIKNHIEDTDIEIKKLEEHSKPLKQDIKKHIRIDNTSKASVDFNFIGREKELSLLNKIWEEENKSVVQITGKAGSGKTALIKEWLSKINLEDFVLWYFYSESDNESRFINSVFSEFEVEEKANEKHIPNLPQKNDFDNDYEYNNIQKVKRQVKNLKEALESRKIILLLDGLELIQNPENGNIRSDIFKELIKELFFSKKLFMYYYNTIKDKPL